MTRRHGDTTTFPEGRGRGARATESVPDLAVLGRARRAFENAQCSLYRTAPRRDDGHRHRRSSERGVYIHMVRMYTWPRTETNQRTNQSTNQPVCAVNKDDDIATTTTRPTPNHARHATPTPATPTPRVSRSAENASCVCSENAFSFSFHFTSSVVRSMYLLRVVIFPLSLSLSHLAPRTVSLPSFLEGLVFF